MEQRMARLEQQMEDHIAISRQFEERNDSAHDAIVTKIDEAMIFQRRLRWTVGVMSTLFGVLLMIIYKHLPWCWEALPKHGHTH